MKLSYMKHRSIRKRKRFCLDLHVRRLLWQDLCDKRGPTILGFQFGNPNEGVCKVFELKTLLKTTYFVVRNSEEQNKSFRISSGSFQERSAYKRISWESGHVALLCHVDGIVWIIIQTLKFKVLCWWIFRWAIICHPLIRLDLQAI